MQDVFYFNWKNKHGDADYFERECPFGQPGDLIWVREAWQPMRGYGAWDLLIKYAANGQSNLGDRHIEDGAADVGDWVFPKAAKNGFVSPIFMPRWASRMTLEIADVRVERVQDIREMDAEREGTDAILVPPHGGGAPHTEGFRVLWDSINAKRGYGWGKNPWVWALTFKVHQCNVDQLLQRAAA